MFDVGRDFVFGSLPRTFSPLGPTTPSRYAPGPAPRRFNPVSPATPCRHAPRPLSRGISPVGPATPCRSAPRSAKRPAPRPTIRQETARRGFRITRRLASTS